jgi:DNA invertase Pin-like site-specific DNA recombinase
VNDNKTPPATDCESVVAIFDDGNMGHYSRQKDRPALRKMLRSSKLDIIVVEAAERLARDRFEWPDIEEFE